MLTIYPARLWLDDGTYVIQVPDVKGCITTADTLEEAYDDIRDALAGCLCTLEDAHLPLPAPSQPGSIQQDGKTVILVDVDLVKYRKETDTRAVRKNVSMPAWLLNMADAHGLNCSQLLQDAIKKELNLV